MGRGDVAAACEAAQLKDAEVFGALERFAWCDAGSRALIASQKPPKAEGVTFVEARRGGWGVRRQGMTLDSTFAPIAQAREVIAAEDFEDTEVVVVFGCGGGALPVAVCEAVEPYKARVVVLEPDPAVLWGALKRDRALGECSDERLCIFTSLQSLKMHLVQTWTDKGRMLVICPPAYRRQYPEVAGALAGEIEEAMILATVNNNTVHSRARQWVNNLLHNLGRRTEHPSLFSMAGAFEGVPAIVAAAGPSLDRNVALLRGLEDKALIVCVNTSLKALLAAGVRPHLVLSLEGLDVSEHFRGVEAEMGRTTLVLDQTCHPKLFEIPAGRIFTFLGGNQRQLDFAARALQEESVKGLPSGGSIANAAFSCVDVLGCDPIVLVGQDLAYTGGQVYASKTVFGGISLESSGESGTLVDPSGLKQKILDESEVEGTAATFQAGRRLIPVKAWGGSGEVMTSADFNLFRLWFQEAGAQANARRGVRLINATEGGAHIEGFDHDALDAVLDDHVRGGSSSDLHARIERLWREGPRVSQGRFQAGIVRAVKDCQAVVRSARFVHTRLLKVEVVLKTKGPQARAFQKALAELERAEQKVAATSRDSPLVDTYVKAALRDILDAAPEDDESAGVLARWRAHLAHSGAVNDAIIQASEALRGRLELARDAEWPQSA